MAAPPTLSKETIFEKEILGRLPEDWKQIHDFKLCGTVGSAVLRERHLQSISIRVKAAIGA